MDNNLSLSQLHRRHIKETVSKAIVVDKTILLCTLPNAVQTGAGSISAKIYINTRILKHLFDKKPAEEYDCILKYMATIVQFPERIYKNKSAKRGDLCFVKTVRGIEYIATIEHRPDDDMCYIVTCFRLRKVSYLDGYNLLWSWKGGTPSS